MPPCRTERRGSHRAANHGTERPTRERPALVGRAGSEQPKRHPSTSALKLLTTFQTPTPHPYPRPRRAAPRGATQGDRITKAFVL